MLTSKSIFGIKYHWFAVFIIIIIQKKKVSYIINVADFYFLESAEAAKNRFKKEANITNIKIEKISENKFKVYSGPYVSFNSMKDTYISLNELGLEN